ncbi:hypothetical protein N7510_010639 [Penicillium lagena]|uniref:uncharacterized protein n=1 Tax=Penicillium lagena TaxID=94218 RepID=UPI00253FE2BF|nr:uncharacterized protein N7510_010639 [Penicillium lagena]KAJ5601105.1 hypothetical protein N7510_010639 [Penicillium lagena]
MKFLTVFTPLIALATTTNGGPVKRTQEVEITFIGAANAQFSQSFPADGSIITISNVLSISHISSDTAGVQCAFNGIDHSVTAVNGAETVDVGPPQTQVSGSCQPLGSGPNPPMPAPQPQPVGGQVQVTFIGAANAQFVQSFPTNGQAMQITNPLSISHIELDTQGVDCIFEGIDHSVTAVNGAQLVDVGPPQTQLSGSCMAA